MAGSGWGHAWSGWDRLGLMQGWVSLGLKLGRLGLKLGQAGVRLGLNQPSTYFGNKVIHKDIAQCKIISGIAEEQLSKGARMAKSSGTHRNNRAQDNPDPDEQQNPAQALLALQNENLFNCRTNVQADISNPANEAQRRNSHGQLLDQVNRAVAARNIPPASSGLARSISAFAKCMLGMDKNQSVVIPSPPTPEEHDIFENHKNEIHGAISQYVNNSLDAARQMYGAIDRSAESKIRAAAIKEVKKIIPEVCYQQLPAISVKSHYFPARWMAHCHRALARSRIPRCTYEWSENSDSPWNSTIMEVFLDSWGLYQQS
ncbi:hypothetical protein PPACK8108_LOCUS23160 [Phakopsora pachyrhizi]|uniref:Uncharacterized protein n=1 Tax=Phakopsora pachyrhizi TaxID=170000 RepID=A0AAV0BLU1_PHAPC|nr:hypothetical protein PPACK8108_LOCUS23160 [Phakopsora pachyrhizi]